MTWTADGNFLEDIERWVLDLKMKCTDCGVPFKFLGMKMGLNYEEPRVSIDGTEARLPVHPADKEPPPLPLKGLRGFDVKKEGDL